MVSSLGKPQGNAHPDSGSSGSGELYVGVYSRNPMGALRLLMAYVKFQRPRVGYCLDVFSSPVKHERFNHQSTCHLHKVLRKVEFLWSSSSKLGSSEDSSRTGGLRSEVYSLCSGMLGTSSRTRDPASCYR